MNQNLYSKRKEQYGNNIYRVRYENKIRNVGNFLGSACWNELLLI